VRLLHRAIDMVSPSIRMVTLRRSAKNIPVPSALDARQRSRQGIQWILKAAERGRAGGQPRNGRLAREIMSVLEGTSAALTRKDEVHRLATVNRSVYRRRLPVLR
jgi:small subunit ribosomal protein S7